MITPENADNRRQHERVLSPFFTFVYNGDVFGQLIDISRGGLAFAYSREQAKVRDLFLELDIMCGTRKLHIPKLFCKTIFDFALDEEENDGKDIRRRCVQFGPLLPDQSLLLEEFLNIVEN